ncbi:MAG: Xaa-Pro peptidase family protein [bacterium]
MKKCLILFLGCSLSFTGLLVAQDCPKGGISAEEYAKRREILVTTLDTSSVFVMRAPEASSEYEYMNYRQDLNFLYLTGVESPGYTLLIVPKGVELNGKRWTSLLFAPSYYLEGSNTFSGSRIPHENFIGKSDTVIPDTELKKKFNQALEGSKTLYYTAPGLSFLHDWLNDKPMFVEKEIQKSLKQAYPGLKISRASNLVGQLRQVKSAEEIELIRNSIGMTGDGIERAMKVCKPGIWEYELQAEVEYGVTSHGAERTSFQSIVGAGKNSLSPHYDDNNCRANAGDVVVMDVGAEYHGYAADITRTIPVSGKFTEEQKTIYETVLKVQKQLIDQVAPGMTYEKIDALANRLFAEAGYKRYVIHGVTHPIGLDVHDVQTAKVLEPGMVITIEPGLYIPANDTVLSEGFRGFGVRIEDDVLVTKDGCEVLSKNIPKEVAEIERLMK